MANYSAKGAGSTSYPAQPSGAGKITPFRVKVDFADLRTSTGAVHTTGVVSTDHIGVITMPKGAMLMSLGLYTKTGVAGGQVDLADGTNTWLSNASVATDDTMDYPDTNPMAQYFYDDDTLLYLNADATMTSGEVWVFGAFYQGMDESNM